VKIFRTQVRLYLRLLGINQIQYFLVFLAFFFFPSCGRGEYDKLYFQSGYSLLKVQELPGRQVISYTSGIGLDVGFTVHKFSDIVWLSTGIGYSNNMNSRLVENTTQNSESIRAYIEINAAIFIGRIGYYHLSFQNPEVYKEHYTFIGFGFLLHHSYMASLLSPFGSGASNEIIKKHRYNIVVNLDFLRNGDVIAKNMLLGLRFNF